MAARKLTDAEKQQQWMDNQYLGVVPYVDAAYQKDPRTQIAANLMRNGMDTSPVAQEGYGLLDGLARIGSGFAGGFVDKRQRAKYQPLEQREAARDARAQQAARDRVNYPDQMNPGMVQQQPAPQMGMEGPVNNIAGALTQQPQAPQVTQPPPGPTPNFTQAPVVNRGQTSPSPAPSRVTTPVAALRSSGRAQERVNSVSNFNSIYEGLIAPNEGGYNPSDPNTGKPVNFGIDQRANPDIDVKNLTPAAARKLMYDRYWKPSNADSVPENLRAMYFDTYVMNPSKAKQFLTESGGDPAAFMGLRRKFLNSINGPHEGWENRNKKVEQYAGITGGGEAGAAPGGYTPMEVPEGIQKPTGEVAKPDLGERVRSSRLQVAYNLLDDPEAQGAGAAYAYAASRPYFDKGYDEDQEAKMQRDENEAQLANTGYSADLNQRNQTQQNYEQQLAQDRQTAQEANINAAATEQEYGLRMEQDRRNNAADLEQYKIQYGAKSNELSDKLLEEYGVPKNEDGTPRTDGIWGVISAGGSSKKPVQQSIRTQIDGLARQSERLDALRASFEANYGGYGNKAVGDTLLAIEGKLPFGADQNRVQWWKSYNAMDSKEIHDLYGAALTGGEEQRWNATVINSGDSEDTIRKNLDTRQEIINAALTRNARAAAASYNPVEVWEIIGGDTAAKRMDEYKPRYRATAQGAKRGQSGSGPAKAGYQQNQQPTTIKTSRGEVRINPKTGRAEIWEPDAPPTRKDRQPGQSRVDWRKAQYNPNSLLLRRP